jgi:hypothetical protein
MREWVRQELAAGRGAEPRQVVELLNAHCQRRPRPAQRPAPVLHDDLDALVSRTEDVLRDDLHVLRLRDLPA